MVIVMVQGASEAQIEHVIERLTELGFDAHRSSGAERTVVGAVGGNVETVDPRELEVLEGLGRVGVEYPENAFFGRARRNRRDPQVV